VSQLNNLEKLKIQRESLASLLRSTEQSLQSLTQEAISKNEKINELQDYMNIVKEALVKNFAESNGKDTFEYYTRVSREISEKEKSVDIDFNQLLGKVGALKSFIDHHGKQLDEIDKKIESLIALVEPQKTRKKKQSS
jgi:vacuolar-type H+-ATPase subunit I/STV1